MSSRKANRAAALALAISLLAAAAPAAPAAGGRELSPAGPRGGERAEAGWLAQAWGWLTSVWGEEGSEIDPNGGRKARDFQPGRGGAPVNPVDLEIAPGPVSSRQ